MKCLQIPNLDQWQVVAKAKLAARAALAMRAACIIVAMKTDRAAKVAKDEMSAATKYELEAGHSRSKTGIGSEGWRQTILSLAVHVGT